MLRAALAAMALLVALAGAPPGVRGGNLGPRLNILSLMTVEIPSHHMWMAPLTLRLAELGHHVVSVDVKEFNSKPPTLNATVIEVPSPLMAAIDIFEKGSIFQKVDALLLFGIKQCSRDMQSPAMMHLVETASKGKFDVVIVDYTQSDCFLAMAHLFDCPVIALTPFPGEYWMDLLMGNPNFPAVLPLVFHDFDTPMTFTQRLTTTLLNAYIYYVVRWRDDLVMNELNRKIFGPGIPPVDELRERVAVALINEIPGLDPARPLPPSIVPVGGMHIKEANLSHIPHDLKKWLDDAKEGFILMSFGSLLRGSNIGPEKRQAFLHAFSKVKQRVLWKFEADDILNDLPPNVRIAKWLPQNDILAHPNIRLFISHGGGLSTQESVYHGVPILGVPFILDQIVNANKARKVGVGRVVKFSDITENLLNAELQELLTNPSYRASAQRLSRVLRDQRDSPLERAVWWVEFVARHRGAPHLRSPALGLPWHQILLVDVIAVLAMAGVALLAAFSLLLWWTARRALSPSRPSARKVDKKD